VEKFGLKSLEKVKKQVYTFIKFQKIGNTSSNLFHVLMSELSVN